MGWEEMYNDMEPEEYKVELGNLATAVWRLNKWSVKHNKEAEVRSILFSLQRFLDNHNVKYIDLTGEVFNEGLAVTIIDSVECERQVVVSMRKPVVLQDGNVIQYGAVCLGEKVEEET